jgi:GMP synthase-like glutamine amidotransferase
MSMDFLVLQHMSWEGPGQHLISAAEKVGIHLDIVDVWRHPIPDGSVYDGLFILGGSPNVDQEEAYPYLRNEKAAIRKMIGMDKPCIGFCLGHQLLAEALGARVGPNFRRSVGFVMGHLTKEGCAHPVFKNLPKSFPLFKWHSQAVLPPLPKGLDVLVTSAECQVEAFSVEGRPHLVGLQYDNHAVTDLDVGAWLEADQAWLSEPPGVDPAAILRETERQEALVADQFEAMLRSYAALISP